MKLSTNNKRDNEEQRHVSTLPSPQLPSPSQVFSTPSESQSQFSFSPFPLQQFPLSQLSLPKGAAEHRAEVGVPDTLLTLTDCNQPADDSCISASHCVFTCLPAELSFVLLPSEEGLREVTYTHSPYKESQDTRVDAPRGIPDPEWNNSGGPPRGYPPLVAPPAVVREWPTPSLSAPKSPSPWTLLGGGPEPIPLQNQETPSLFWADDL